VGGREIQPTGDGVIWRELRKTDENLNSPFDSVLETKTACGETKMVGVEEET
jgi:hypothetical protein